MVEEGTWVVFPVFGEGTSAYLRAFLCHGRGRAVEVWAWCLSWAALVPRHRQEPGRAPACLGLALGGAALGRAAEACPELSLTLSVWEVSLFRVCEGKPRGRGRAPRPGPPQRVAAAGSARRCPSAGGAACAAWAQPQLCGHGTLQRAGLAQWHRPEQDGALRGGDSGPLPARSAPRPAPGRPRPRPFLANDEAQSGEGFPVCPTAPWPGVSRRAACPMGGRLIAPSVCRALTGRRCPSASCHAFPGAVASLRDGRRWGERRRGPARFSGPLPESHRGPRGCFPSPPHPPSEPPSAQGECQGGGGRFAGLREGRCRVPRGVEGFSGPLRAGEGGILFRCRRKPAPRTLPARPLPPGAACGPAGASAVSIRSSGARSRWSSPAGCCAAGFWR